MKPMKNNSKTKVNIVAAESVPSIKSFFRSAPIGLNCVEDKASDSKVFYIRALKDKLKGYDGETKEENVTKKCNTTQNENENAVAIQSGIDDRNFPKDDGAVESDTDNRNNCEGAGVVGPGTNDDERNEDVVLDVKKAHRLCDASCELLRQKYKELKASHFIICQRHCELSVKYDELVKTLDAIKSAKSSNAADVNSDVASSSAAASDALSSTDGVFTPNQIRILESLPLDKKKDSTFILQCIEYAYKGSASTLVNKTLKGTLDKTEFRDDGNVVVRPGKDPLTPEKVARIEELFISRVTKSKCLAGEFSERIKTANINRLIASAIRNVVNKVRKNRKINNRRKI